MTQEIETKEIVETNEAVNVGFLKKVTPYSKDGQAGKIVFQFGDSKEPLVLDISRVSTANAARALIHGLSQKIGDSASGFSKGNRYKEAREAVAEQIELMYSDSWVKATGGKRPETEQDIADLIEAIAKVQKVKPKTIMETIRAADREQRDTWRKHPQIKLELATIEFTRTQKDIPQFKI